MRLERCEKAPAAGGGFFIEGERGAAAPRLACGQNPPLQGAYCPLKTPVSISGKMKDQRLRPAGSDG